MTAAGTRSLLPRRLSVATTAEGAVRRLAGAPALPRQSSRTPIHPGRFLETRFLLPARLSQDALARALGISRRRVNELVRGRRAISPDTAVRLALFFGTDPNLWTSLQAAWDTRQALRTLVGRRPREEGR